MKLSSLLQGAGLPARARPAADPSITGLTEDSRCAGPGSLFVAIRGTRDDGLAHVASALERGAVAVVAATPRAPGIAAEVPWIEVPDARRGLAELAATFHGFPAKQLVVSGITGSKGKTTTGYLMAAVADAAGEPSALLGSVVYRTGLFEHPSTLTTPAAPLVHQLLAEAVKARMQGAILEVSSHALDQERLHGIRFELGVFTNLFPDHLDYHTSVDAYFLAKRKLFVGEHAAGRAVIGIEGRHGKRLAAEHPAAVTFGSNADADVRPLLAEVSRQGVRLTAHIPGGRQVVLDSPLLGRFNAFNLLAAAAFGVARGFEPEAVREGVRAVDCVPGRMQPVDLGQPYTCLVDYSHTGPALEGALRSVREWTSGRVLVVVGAGGNRDRERRRAIGVAAAELADSAILTNDNPRDEDPLAILQEIETAYLAAGGSAATVIPDRAEAIAAAVNAAHPGDTVLVAGKGHETYQILGQERRPFDDRKVIAEALRSRGHGK